MKYAILACLLMAANMTTLQAQSEVQAAYVLDGSIYEGFEEASDYAMAGTSNEVAGNATAPSNRYAGKRANAILRKEVVQANEKDTFFSTSDATMNNSRRQEEMPTEYHQHKKTIYQLP